jgi:hypothetical protein
MPRILSLFALPLLAAASLTAAGSAEAGSFLRTETYELVTGADPDRWCGPDEDPYVGDDWADLRGAHFALSLSCLFHAPSIPDRLAAEAPELQYLPAAVPGDEFLIVQVAHQALYFPEIEASTTESWIMAGAKRVYLGAPPAAGTFLALTVPAGAETVLWVEDAGRAQGLDLRTGARVDPVEGYYSGPAFATFTGEAFDYDEIRFGNASGGWRISCDNDGARVSRTMWTDQLGWAPEGSVYLAVWFWWCGEDTFDETTWELDKDGAFDVMIGMESVERLQWDETPATGEWGGTIHELVFEVPVAQHEFKLLFTPTGELTESSNGEVFEMMSRPAPTVWTVNF